MQFFDNTRKSWGLFLFNHDVKKRKFLVCLSLSMVKLVICCWLFKCWRKLSHLLCPCGQITKVVVYISQPQLWIKFLFFSSVSLQIFHKYVSNNNWWTHRCSFHLPISRSVKSGMKLFWFKICLFFFAIA